jgi:hypothetical protein
MLLMIAGLLVIIVCLLGSGQALRNIAGLVIAIVILPGIIYSFSQVGLGGWLFIGSFTIIVVIVAMAVRSMRNQSQR